VNWTVKNSAAAADTATASTEPARVEMAGIDKIKELRRNTTNKFLLINFWATWCAPCEDEFPQVQSIYRTYRQRPFDVVMVSTNDPDDKEGVLKFLNQQHAVTRNYLFNVADPIDIIAAFGADFNGGVPFTVLLAPDGRVIYEKLGEIDSLEVRRLILKNLPDDPQHPGTRDYWNSSF
jgi:thiol-disulfide isomerase/thioredoxin